MSSDDEDSDNVVYTDTGDFSVAARLDEQFQSLIGKGICEPLKGKKEILDIFKTVSTTVVDSKKTGVDG
jgi:hypothetical protein